MKPEGYTTSSHKRVWWLCPKGHSYDAIIVSKSEPEETSEKRTRRKRRTRKRSDGRKSDESTQNPNVSNSETNEENGNSENGKIVPNSEDKPRRRRRGRRGGRKRRVTADQVPQSDEIEQPTNQNIIRGEVPTDLIEGKPADETTSDPTNPSNAQRMSHGKEPDLLHFGPAATLPSDLQDTKEISDAMAPTKDVRSTKPLTSPDFEDSTSVMSELPNKENATTDFKTARSTRQKIVSNNKQKPNEIGIKENLRQKETPPEPSTQKRRGWWQRGKIF